MVQLLLASGQLRQDLQTAVDFITMRVKAPGKDDWGNVKRGMKYIKGTLGANMTLRTDSLYMIKWWVDVSFAMHNN